MSSGSDYDYESVLCAALLHDIGKFYQRGRDERTRHSLYSAAFVEGFKNSFLDADLVKDLVSHHHESQYTPAEERPDAISDSRVRGLAYLVSRADSFSSRERPEDTEGSGVAYQPRAALDTVFSQVDIGRGDPDPTAKRLKYRLAPIFDDSYPHDLGADYQHSLDDYDTHVNRFLGEFRTLFERPYSGMADTMAALIQKYMWCIPSDTTREIKDVSLADHLKTTCALAACFYKYHEAIGWDEKTIKDDSLCKCLLVCGDLSGIQDYIYGVASIGHGGVAKRLRGRSFRISLLAEAVALRLLRGLELPTACKIISAGGNFYILAPNTPKALEYLENARDEVCRWLLDEYTGELALSLVWTELGPDRLKQGKFDEALDEVNGRLAEAKLRKYAALIAEGPQVFDIDYAGKGACPVCDRRPASGSPDDPQPCAECSLDERLGQRLVSAEWVAFSKTASEPSVELFGDWYAGLARDNEELAGLEPFAALRLRPGELAVGLPCGFGMYAGYVPRWANREEFEAVAAKCRDLQEEEPPAVDGQVPKSFSAIAATSTGAHLLGVLRADVDFLGLVFGIGLKGLASLSRIASLSAMLGTFFSVELTRLVSEDFPDCYIAYSGGDDLMVIGPWDQTVELSAQIARRFKDYTAGNPNLSISAGIGTFRHKTPIATSSVLTGEILERSKSAGRDRLTLFQTTITWEQFDEMMTWSRKLAENVPSGFLYRLLGYQASAADYFAGRGGARAALFKPHLAYDIARNLCGDEGQPKIDSELYDRLCTLLGPDSRAAWDMLKAPISWASYAGRKGGES